MRLLLLLLRCGMEESAWNEQCRGVYLYDEGAPSRESAERMVAGGQQTCGGHQHARAFPFRRVVQHPSHAAGLGIRAATATTEGTGESRQSEM